MQPTKSRSIWTSEFLGVPTCSNVVFEQPIITSLWQIPGWVGNMVPELASPHDYTPTRSRLSGSLEEAFAAFNGQDAPEYAAEVEVHRLHSMSTGDVLVTAQGSFLCLPSGWACLDGDWTPDTTTIDDWAVPQALSRRLKELSMGGTGQDAIYMLARQALSPRQNQLGRGAQLVAACRDIIHRTIDQLEN